VQKSSALNETENNNSLESTSRPSAQLPEPGKNGNPPAVMVAATDKAVDRQSDSASPTVEPVAVEGLSEGNQPPESSPPTTQVGAVDPQADSTSTTIETLADEGLSAENQPPESSPPTTRIGKEVLRIDTEDFILTIERPEPALKNEAVHSTLAKWTTDELIHIVVRGDTLWDIADHYLGDPFRYPELAALSHIKDPHWIYPGDVIRIIRKKPANQMG
jgi:nucleoid-associated protein YgaU